MNKLKLYSWMLFFLYFLSAHALSRSNQKLLNMTQSLISDDLCKETIALKPLKDQTRESYLIRSPPIRCTPTAAADTLKFSVQIEGKTNQVIINGKQVKSDTSSTQKKNIIRVSGEGNSVEVLQTNDKSEVKVKQSGSNNKVEIIQSN